MRCYEHCAFPDEPAVPYYLIMSDRPPKRPKPADQRRESRSTVPIDPRRLEKLRAEATRTDEVGKAPSADERKRNDERTAKASPPPLPPDAAKEFGIGGGSINEAITRLTGDLTQHLDAQEEEEESFEEEPSIVQGLLERVRELEAEGAHAAALLMGERLGELAPDSSRVQQHLEQLRERVTREANPRIAIDPRLANLEVVPKLQVSPNKIHQHYEIDPRCAFLLSQIDGQTSYRELLALSGMSREETMQALSRLLELGLIGG